MLIDRKELSARLGLSEAAIRERTHSGRLPAGFPACLRIGRLCRYDSADVERFVDLLKAEAGRRSSTAAGGR